MQQQRFDSKKFGCLTVSYQSVSNLAASLSDEVSGKLHNNGATCQAFQEAKSDTEFTADGAFIKIRHTDKSYGWLEYKIAGFGSGSEVKVQRRTSGTAVNCRSRW